MATGTTARPERRASPRPEHRTAPERAARGKAARAEVPRSSHGGWEPAADRPDPVALLEEQAHDPRARARADPLRPHARVAVRVLPRRRADHGGRPRRHAARPGCTVQLCGDAHLSNFGAVRLARARAACSTSTTSTRRCPARGSGTSSGSPRAWRSPAANNGFTDEGARRRSCSRRCASTARRCGSSRRCATSTSGTRASTIEARRSSACRRKARPEERARTPSSDVAKARTKRQHAGVLEADPEVDGEPRIISDPPLIVPIDELRRPADARAAPRRARAI